MGEPVGATDDEGLEGILRVQSGVLAATAIGAFGSGITRWVNSVSMSFDEAGTLWAVINYVPPEHDTDIPADWSDLATIDPASWTICA